MRVALRSIAGLLAAALMVMQVPSQAAEKGHFLERCKDPRYYTRTGGNPTVSQDEYLDYLRELERLNPTATWKQTTAALHAAQYGDDLDRTLPLIPAPLFQHGEETDGYKDIDLGCHVTLSGKKNSFTPKFVITKRGKKVDIGHALAAIRSDLNRPHDSAWTDFMRGANTSYGDLWQVLMHADTSRFPIDQLRGNLMGVQIARFARNRHIQERIDDFGLVDFFEQFFDDVEAYNEREEALAKIAAVNREKSNGPDSGSDTKQPEPGKSPNQQDLRDQANRLAATIDSNLQEAEGFFARLASQCNAILAADDLDHAGKLAQVKAQAINPALCRAHSELAKIEDDKATSERLSEVVEKGRERARQERGKACSVQTTSQSGLEAIREAARKARNHAVLAAQTGKEALARGEQALAAANSALPVPREIRDKFTAMFENYQAACRVIKGTDQSTFNPTGPAEKLLEAEAGLARLRALLENTKFPDQEKFTQRAAALENRAQALAAKEYDGRACSKAYLRLQRDCRSADIVPAEVELELNAYTQAHKEVTEKRRLSLVALRQRLDRTNRHINDAAEAAREARECLDTAQSNQHAALSQRLNDAVRSCNVSALPALKSEVSRIAPDGGFDEELALLETASTGVSQFKDGKVTFNAGDYAEAKAPLGHALSSFKELPSGACQTYADRAQEGLDQIEKVLAQQAIVDRAIDTCNVEDLKTILAKYDGRKFRFFTESSARIRAALPKCEEEDRIIAEGKFCDKMRGMVDAASSDFMANRLKAARLQLNALDKKLTPTNTERCSELNARVRRGLDQLDILEAEQERLTQAESACDVDRLKQLPARYDGKKHPWFKTALARARGAIEECEDERPLTEEEAIADCRRQVEAKGKVYAATDYSPDGSYKCHWCEKGQVSNGVACVWDTAAAEADCRRQASAKGKVYAKTVVHNDGRYDCLWCERGQVYANGQCGTVAAHGEAECRRLAASKGKVYAATQVLPNGRLNCRWCEPGQYYANGRCHYPQQAQPRVQPQPRPSTRTAPPAPCHPGTMGGPDYENCMRSRGLPIPRGNYPR